MSKAVTNLEAWEGVARRLSIARKSSVVSHQALADAAGVTRREIVEAFFGNTIFTPEQLLAIARACGVDPRWLAQGVRSRAGSLAWKTLSKHREASGSVAAPEDTYERLFPIFQTIEEPSVGLEVCRYCGCTPERACGGGCAWVDVEETICSACLDPTRAPDDAED